MFSSIPRTKSTRRRVRQPGAYLVPQPAAEQSALADRQRRRTRKKVAKPVPQSAPAPYPKIYDPMDVDEEPLVCVPGPATTSRKATVSGELEGLGAIADDAAWEDIPETIASATADSPSPKAKPARKKRSIVPSPDDYLLYSRWEALLPDLRQPYLEFRGKLPSTCPSTCTTEGCNPHVRKVKCVYWKHYEERTFVYCEHRPLGVQMVATGLFPASPVQTHYGFDLDFLDFYFHLFEHTADSAEATAAALAGFHQQFGVTLTDGKGRTILEGYQRPLQHAIQWYDVLRNKVDREIEDVIEKARKEIEAQPELLAKLLQSQQRASGPRGRCSLRLRNLCPACFGGSRFGRTMAQGLDVHVALDANFLHRHDEAGGQCPPFAFQYVFLIGEDRVEAAEKTIEGARAGPKKPYQGRVPEVAIDGCRDAHTAADEDKHKTSSARFDDKGLMALVCRHDIPLCFVNITTPGEGQKYVLACLNWFFEQLPLEATVAALYDIGCVFDRSRQLYALLPEEISSRLVFATSAMHAYAHQWSCQLVYNPRMKEGIGLTDGEGVERLWSRLRRLIGVTRHTHRRRRLVMLDRQLQRYQRSKRDELFRWFRRRNKHIATKRKASQEILADSGFAIPQLQEQWASQVETGLSARAHLPQRLRKNLKTVVSLQEQLDGVELSMASAERTFRSGARQIPASLVRLKTLHADLTEEVERLHAAVDIFDELPGISGHSVQFLHTLLRAYDAKRTCRAKIIGRFSEWDRLEAALGGKQQALGTNEHQRTRASIKKRTPALTRSIARYNALCSTLRDLRPSGSRFPLPEPLSTELAHLRCDESLLMDVYLADGSDVAPAWVTNSKVREAIRAMQAIARCDEEEARVQRELENVLEWVGFEAAALQHALKQPENASVRHILAFEYERLSRMAAEGGIVLQTTEPGQVQTQRSSPVSVMLTPPSTPPHVRVSRSVPSTSGARLDDAIDVDALADDDDSDPELIFPDTDGVIAGDLLDEQDKMDNWPEFDVPNLVEVPFEEVPEEYLLRDTHEAVATPPIPSGLNLYIDTGTAYLGHVLTTSALERLVQTDWVSDETVASAIAVLCDMCTTRLHKVFIMSTWEMAQWTYYRKTPEWIFKRWRKLKPWTKSIIIFPIHRYHHWTLVLLWPATGRVEFFDSLGSANMKLICTTAVALIQAVWTVARQRGEDFPAMANSWTYEHMLRSPIQLNVLDCGVWIIAQVEAILRSYRGVAWGHAEMPNYRRWLATKLLAIRLATPVHS